MNHFSPKLRNVMVAAFAVIFAMLGILKYRELSLVQNSIESAGWVKHTYQVTSLLDKNLLLLDDAETSQRGFLLTGREEYLEPFISASPRIGENLDDLLILVRDFGLSGSFGTALAGDGFGRLCVVHGQSRADHRMRLFRSHVVGAHCAWRENWNPGDLHFQVGERHGKFGRSFTGF